MASLVSQGALVLMGYIWKMKTKASVLQLQMFSLYIKTASLSFLKLIANHSTCQPQSRLCYSLTIYLA